MWPFCSRFSTLTQTVMAPAATNSAEAAHHGGAARISLSKEDRNSNYCRIGSEEQRWSNNSKMGCFTRGAPSEASPASCIIERA
jgi:D-tyrosyl-tRNA(Tyr) deacylase